MKPASDGAEEHRERRWWSEWKCRTTKGEIAGTQVILLSFFFPRRHVDFFFIFLSLRATTAPFFLLHSLTEGPAAASDSFLYKRCGDNAALALAWRPT